MPNQAASVSATKKRTKADVDYTPMAANPKERCSKCEYFLKGQRCRKVTGDISPYGWCKLFSAQ